jgi:RNA polymerase sigma-70 factor (ECF subfamily)
LAFFGWRQRWASSPPIPIFGLASLWNFRILSVNKKGQELTATVPDLELVLRFRETADADCFTELFFRHRKRVYLACLRFFPDVGTAEDVTQETFLRAYTKLRQFQGGSFEAWLVQIAKNACIDHWRRVRMETELDNAESTVASPGKSLEEHSDLRFAAERLQEEMKGLAPDQRRCLEMKIEGYSYDETAARTGLSVDAVKSHLQNGRRMLWLRMEGVLSRLK